MENTTCEEIVTGHRSNSTDTDALIQYNTLQDLIDCDVTDIQASEYGNFVAIDGETHELSDPENVDTDY